MALAIDCDEASNKINQHNHRDTEVVRMEIKYDDADRETILQKIQNVVDNNTDALVLVQASNPCVFLSSANVRSSSRDKNRSLKEIRWTVDLMQKSAAHVRGATYRNHTRPALTL